jgi:excisionase family DNA binding protein
MPHKRGAKSKPNLKRKPDPTFMQADLARTLRAMRAAGIPVGSIEIDSDRHRVTVSAGGSSARVGGVGAGTSGYMNMRDACQYGNFGRTRAYQLIAEGVLKAKKLGKRTLISRSSIDKMLSSLVPMPNKKRVRKRRAR